MRRKNESAVLSLIRRFGGVSSADISRRSGLAPQTVSVLLKGLEKRGIVIRGGVLRGRRGQPAVPILLNPDGGYGIGVEVGWRHLDFILVNLRGEVLARKRQEFDYPRAENLVEQVLDGVRCVLKVLPEQAMSRVAGLGVAMPTNMSVNLHTVGATKAEMDALEQLDIVKELEEKFSFPVVVINDGTAACRAECAYGRGTDYGDLVYIFLGTYVGSGIFVDGRVIEGRSGDAANVGASMVPNAQGEIRTLHLIASVKALENTIVAAGKSVPRSSPMDWDWQNIAPEVDAWLDEAANGLTLAIANSCAVVDFSAAIIDGVLPRKLLMQLVDKVQMRIAKLPITTFEPPTVIIGTRGASAPAIGAANFPIYLTIFAPEQTRQVSLTDDL